MYLWINLCTCVCIEDHVSCFKDILRCHWLPWWGQGGKLPEMLLFWKSYYKLCLTVVKRQVGGQNFNQFDTSPKDTCVPGHPLSFPKQWGLASVTSHKGSLSWLWVFPSSEGSRIHYRRRWQGSFLGKSVQRNLWVKVWSLISTSNWQRLCVKGVTKA